MNPRAGIGILVCSIGILSAQAQSEKKDSLQQKKEGEIYINQEAVKSIEFNFLPQTEIMKAQPKMDERKPWMEFRKDLPSSLTDTTSLRKMKHIRMLPYTPYTRHDEDPIGRRTLTKDASDIRMELNMEKIKPKPWLKHGYRVVPGGMDQSVTPSNRPVTGFNADKALFETFTKRGRTIRRNRKKAKAWKTYKDYVPTKEDSLKWYGRKEGVYQKANSLSKSDVIQSEAKNLDYIK